MSRCNAPARSCSSWRCGNTRCACVRVRRSRDCELPAGCGGLQRQEWQRPSAVVRQREILPTADDCNVDDAEDSEHGAEDRACGTRVSKAESREQCRRDSAWSAVTGRHGQDEASMRIPGSTSPSETSGIGKLIVGGRLSSACLPWTSRVHLPQKDLRHL